MWYYQGKEFTKPDRLYSGFVYILTNTRFSEPKYYIGQKTFGSKAIKWQDYYGSNKRLLDEIKRYSTKYIQREILYLCKAKSVLNYMENREIILRDAIIRKDYYNEFAGGKMTLSDNGKREVKNLINHSLTQIK